MLGRERERVADHQADTPPFGLELVATERPAARGADELHGKRLDRPGAGRQEQGNRGLVLGLAGVAGHRFGDASDQRDRADLGRDRFEQGLGREVEVLRGEEDGKPGRLGTQGGTSLFHRLAGRLARVGGEYERGTGLHRSRL